MSRGEHERRSPASEPPVAETSALVGQVVPGGGGALVAHPAVVLEQDDVRHGLTHRGPLHEVGDLVPRARPVEGTEMSQAVEPGCSAMRPSISARRSAWWVMMSSRRPRQVGEAVLVGGEDLVDGEVLALEQRLEVLARAGWGTAGCGRRCWA